jgi:Rab family protein
VTNSTSFANVKNWLESIQENADKDIIKMLVGNKIDLEDDRKIMEEEARELAAANDMEYLETSAKANINVKESIESMMEKIYI